MRPLYSKVTFCRACGSENITATEINKNYYLLNLDQTVSLSYAVCNECQFIFQSEYVGDDFLEYYYKKSPMLRRTEPTKFEVDQNRRQAEFVSRHISLKEKSVLEIGAHAGAFLVYLYQEFGCNAYYDELSVEARRVLSMQDGIMDYSVASPGAKIDLIILRHVLEHIYELESFIDYVRSIINERGYLFVEVPDWSWLDRQTDPFVFEHINQFSTYNLINLMRRMGWQCEAVEKSIVADDPATPNRVQRLLFTPSDFIGRKNSNIGYYVSRFYNDVYGQGNIAINKLIAGLDRSKKLALYPASHLTFAALCESDLLDANLVGIFDIDSKKHGKVVEGVEVYPADRLKECEPDIILLFTMGYEREIRNSFDEMGVEAEVISISQIISDLSAN